VKGLIIGVGALGALGVGYWAWRESKKAPAQSSAPPSTRAPVPCNVRMAQAQYPGAVINPKTCKPIMTGGAPANDWFVPEHSKVNEQCWSEAIKRGLDPRTVCPQVREEFTPIPTNPAFPGVSGITFM